jgi:hypothetical protein
MNYLTTVINRNGLKMFDTGWWPEICVEHLHVFEHPLSERDGRAGGTDHG